ncbi:MAG: hypothetical protein ACTSUB_09220 [Candidatus Thorarchaeota archaeon]
MAAKKWIMKQYWRVGTIRTLSSLAMGMFVLGRLYYEYIPGLRDLGVLGALTLGMILVLFFMFLGWLYDVKARMWTQQRQSAVERNPFSYMPEFRALAVDYPIHYGLMISLKSIVKNLKGDTHSIDESLKYLDKYFNRKINRTDIFSSQPAAKEFMEKFPFSEYPQQIDSKVGFSPRAKLSFQVHMLRLTWIQSLTGLVQDVLIFGSFFITLLYFGGTDVVEGIVPLDILLLGFLAISLPLFLFLTFLGWLYDRKLRIWTPDQVVKIERNPFTYIAEPRLPIMVFPFFFVILHSCRNIMIKQQLDTQNIDRILDYLNEYSQFDVTRDQDMREARKKRSAYGPIFETTKEEVES